ncbi:glycosyl transferase family 2 [Pseudomonas sp. S25]|uniref:Glycosyl transferase family 2 n=1 Tax=Pseudomonas maioricensis TaxID=1766623 RepID=A0ABS9ZKS1_9PSED|nr:glycosyltransferase [Pseudomonas sp. S25]MCI8210921.1 glycosyl transferase family 2 [Pseudomonas sp. S25]
MIKLQEKGYRFNSETGIWVRDDYQGLSYSDGDESEERIARIIREAEDLSVLSRELTNQSVGWASIYHLDSARANILRPFEGYLCGRTLEVGAGCGAISRYLGECGGSVLSLEGSVRRAHITASRTRDLDNVVVVAERFEEFDTDERFNVVTLIGVLEYAGVFSQDKDAALRMLKRARQLLLPDGKLFIAIENQLGLKYFAGAPEDHIGLPMYGIEGRYTKGKPQTFGRKELDALIKAAGFQQSEFLYPAPDYKLPHSIITERGFNTDSFDAAALAWQSAKRDLQLPKETTFNLERTWPVVISNGLGTELANSFLVAASCAAETCVGANILAYHYNTGRIPVFCKSSRFIKTPTGIEVQHERLFKGPWNQPESHFQHILTDVDSYVCGAPLSQRFVNIATTPDWMTQDFGVFIREYLEHLRALLSVHECSLELKRIDEQLPGIFVDAVPQNILVKSDGTPLFIDVEWDLSGGVELGYLLVRGLLPLITSTQPFHPSIMPPTRKQFMLEAIDSAGLVITEEDINRYVALEALFQGLVTGRSASEFLDWKPDEPINQKVVPAAVPLQAKLYYSNGDGEFKEYACITHDLIPGHQQLCFSFASMPARPRRLRLDPVDQKVSFALDNVRLLRGGNEVWAWDRDVQSLIATSGLMRVDKSGTPVFFLSLDDDPYLELPVDLSFIDGVEHLSLHLDLVLYTDEVMARLVSVELNSVSQYQQAFQSSLAPLAEQIQALSRSVGDLDRVTHGLAESVIESEKDTIGMVERLLVDHRQILTRQMGELDRVTHSLAESVIETEHETIETIERLLSDQSHVVNERGLQIERLKQELRSQQIDKDTHIHHLNLHVIALESSYSRRLSAPVRKSLSAIRRVKRISTLVPSMVQRGGGLTETMARVIRVLRQHGVKGLVDRVRWFSGTDHGQNENLLAPEVPSRHDYAAWIERYDTLSVQSRWEITEHIRTWEKQPLISIIMPVFDPPLDLLRAAVDSVRYQLYPHWELCIADDASTDLDVRQYLEQLQHDDPQIKVVFREHNGHICAASNSAIELARGDYLALMDNDDLIAEHALYWVARAVVENPEVGLIYSDEDKIDLLGKRSSAYFKPDWNAFLFRSQNMICHLGVYRRDVVERVGGFRLGFEGAQDYDLAMRCAEQLKPDQIFHIPRVLYHWRIHEGSTAQGGDQKPYAAEAGLKALNEHLQRQSMSAHAELLPMGMYRVRHRLPDVLPLVSLIIPTRNAHVLVKQCIDSIRQLTTYENYEIILVDNGSDDEESLRYFAELEGEADVLVIRDERPFNYSALNNLAVRQARGELVGLINNDIEVISPQWLEEMVSLALLPGVGAVGARLWYPDDRLQHGGVIVGIGGVAGHSHKCLPRGEYGYFCRASLIQEMSAVTAACMVIRKSVFEQVNGLDEVNLKVAFNDVDFCLRLREAGYVNVFTPFAELYHHESATRGAEDTRRKKKRFKREIDYMLARWPEIKVDYAYNPNLTLDHEDFGLAWPPRV